MSDERKLQPVTIDADGRVHGYLAVGSPLATQFYTWDELDALAMLVDAELAASEHTWSTGDGHWSMLNSLRTSLREAQFGLQRLNPPDDPPEPPARECRAKRWNGTPCHEGPHPPHAFHYGGVVVTGPGSVRYDGHCGGVG